MGALDRHTSFEQFEKGDRVAVHFTRTPRTSADGERRLTGEIIAMYTDEKALIDSIPESDRDCWWVVNFADRHTNDGVRKHKSGDGLGAPVYVEATES